MTEKSNERRASFTHRFLVGAPVLLGGVAALAAPVTGQLTASVILGLLLIVAGAVELFTLFTQSTATPAVGAFVSPAASVVAGLLLLNAPDFTFAGLAVVIGLAIMVDGVTKLFTGLREQGKKGGPWVAWDGAFNVLLGLGVAVQWPVSGVWSLGVVVGLRLLSVGWSLLLGRTAVPAGEDAGDSSDRHPNPKLRLPPNPVFARERERFAAETEPRHQTARHWRVVFLATFFVIHASRMHVGWTVAGWWGPTLATLGDVLVALLLAYVLVAPLRLFWRWLTRPLERRAWQRLLRHVDGATQDARPSLRERWLERRMRGDLDERRGRRSISAAIGWGLTYGLPLAAVLVAIAPALGFSWFFNTESWTAALNEYWATERTDVWRADMVNAVRAVTPQMTDAERFQVQPAGVDGPGDFSFIVIGDTGEGDPSQLVLHDQLLRVGNRPDVKFMVISSDVIYPSGEMHDYERKFYLPLKGFAKPIYAIPGNHDWFDGLEGFAADFFRPDAAIAALRARRAADRNLTSLTQARVQDVVHEAQVLRDYYGLQVARQRAPFFELQTADFALLAVDTGILRRVDPVQMNWLRGALDRSRGKFLMVILGHPVYTTGRYMGDANPSFRAVHDLLRRYGAKVIMAGDTHAFEFYRVPHQEPEGAALYFTNGGGGAYLSIETPLDWAPNPPVAAWAYYPRTDSITAKLNAQTPIWKRPLWLWVRDLKGWPLSVQPLATAFSYDQAPFFQSFMEVRVERLANRVRLKLYGAQGALHWRDLQTSADVIPPGQSSAGDVEFTLPLHTSKRP